MFCLTPSYQDLYRLLEQKHRGRQRWRRREECVEHIGKNREVSERRIQAAGWRKTRRTGDVWRKRQKQHWLQIKVCKWCKTKLQLINFAFECDAATPLRFVTNGRFDCNCTLLLLVLIVFLDFCYLQLSITFQANKWFPSLPNRIQIHLYIENIRFSCDVFFKNSNLETEFGLKSKNSLGPCHRDLLGSNLFCSLNVASEEYVKWFVSKCFIGSQNKHDNPCLIRDFKVFCIRLIVSLPRHLAGDESGLHTHRFVPAALWAAWLEKMAMSAYFPKQACSSACINSGAATCRRHAAPFTFWFENPTGEDLFPSYFSLLKRWAAP